MDGIDAIEDYIWRRRIHHGVRYQKGAVPFPESVEIGLEFNAALERKEKLDVSLLTNAVMLELCDFAKTVTKSETYFLFEMMEFNFDLGVDVDDDAQYYEYSRRVHNKIKLLKEQIKTKPHRWKETFPLPEVQAIIRAAAASKQSARYYPKRNKMVDTSVLSDGGKRSQNRRAESNEGFTTTKPGAARVRGTGDAYPFCKKLGVTLAVGAEETSKEKLDPSLVTNGVMMELLCFSRALCGTHTAIVHDLVKQNFGHELDKTLLRVHVTRLMERKYACLTAEDRDAFRREAFKVQTEKREQNRKKRRNPDADYEELEKLTVASKRRETLRHRDGDAREIELSYMCPVDFDTEMQSGSEVEPETLERSTAPQDVKEEDEEVYVSSAKLHTNDRDSRSYKKEKIATLKATWDLFSEDKNDDTKVKTRRQKLWMRSAARSKQILKSSRVNDTFARCREIGLDFNVGSGLKRELDLRLLTNRVLLEVHKYATAMTRSLSRLLFDVLDGNFNLVLHDELHRRNFLFYIITKEKLLQNHAARRRTEFLSSPFHFPDVYSMVDVTGDFQTRQEVETKWDSAPPDTSRQADEEPHPFCQRLGIDLWATERRPPSQKLDVTLLTTGAVLEIVGFVRDLCGNVRETVNDVLEHNFDLDLQSGTTEAAQVIHRWFGTQKSLIKKQNTAKINRWLNAVVPLNGRSQLGDDGPDDPDPEDLKLERGTGVLGGNAPQVEKVAGYHICERIGLDLDVASKSEAKTKLDLQVLTRGVLVEMHRYVEQNCHRYVPALYEILEYNFDLSSQRHRRVEFAWSIAAQVMAIAAKNGRKGDYLNRVFELPFDVSESSQVDFKREPEDEPDPSDASDIVFVRELKPVDIEVEIE